MLASFKGKAEAVGAEVHLVPDPSAAVDFVVRFLGEAGVADRPGARAVWADGSLLAGLDRGALARQIPGLTFAVTQAAASDSKVGVTEVGFAVANTGSLAGAADDPAQRLASALPAIHLAVVRADALVPDLAALFQRLSPAQTRYLALITGPSRTADIERVLTIGVHGPERLVVVVIDQGAAGAAATTAAGRA